MSLSYLEKSRFVPRQIHEAVSEKLQISVVIPCHNEPALLNTLSSLEECTQPDCDVEVIVVVNAGEGSEPEIEAQNIRSFEETILWSSKHTTPGRRYFTMMFNDLPPRHAGVGLARKIGMDEAADRFEQIGNPGGIILCLDADCTVETTYLQSVFEHFRSRPETPACSIYFEHPLKGDEDPQIYEGIVRYELFLRYYVEALRYARYPHAFHTIGSSMAVRSGIYQQQGGMNRRKAGEDFYFLHKLMPLGNFTEITASTVFPSPRVSGRVPFGTGRAMGEWMRLPGRYETYSLQVFSEIRTMCLILETLPIKINEGALLEDFKRLPPGVWQFLEMQGIEEKTKEILGNVSGSAAFVSRFYRWFNGFMMLKYVHYSRDRQYPNVPVEEAATELAGLLNLPLPAGNDALALLTAFRQLQRRA